MRRRTFTTKCAVLFAATTAVTLALSGATALAAGQQLCVGGPDKTVLTPDRNGQCKNGYTVTTLATESEVSSLQSTVTDLQSRVSTLEATLSKVSYDPSGLNGKPTLKISGANVQIVSGSGSTDGTVNGLGNLIIGYDEHPPAYDQTGSHNLVLGYGQKFTSWGGVSAGVYNTLSGPFSDVFGVFNTASSGGSSITGGESNTASGGNSSVSGGASSTASGNYSSVSGGGGTTATGDYSSILGGNGVIVNAEYGTYPAGP
jgi:hypothetical protein